MPPEDLSIPVDKITGLIALSRKPLQKRAVVAVRHETDVLAVLFLRVDKAMGRSDLPNLCLGQVSQREQGVPELFLGQKIKDVGLILLRVRRLLKPQRISRRRNAGIVPRGDKVAAKFPGPLPHGLKFQVPVAVDAGIGGQARLIGRGKGPHHVPFKFPGEIQRVVGDSQPGADALGVFHIAQGAAGPLFAAAVELHGHTDALVSRLHQTQRRNGGIHASAHADHAGRHPASLLSQGFIIPAASSPCQPVRGPGIKLTLDFLLFLSYIKNRT